MNHRKQIDGNQVTRRNVTFFHLCKEAKC